MTRRSTHLPAACATRDLRPAYPTSKPALHSALWDEAERTAPRDYAVRRSRPFRRRAATIARPARVRMRSRKPWVRARRRLFGWNVRFTPEGYLLPTGDPPPVRCATTVAPHEHPGAPSHPDTRRRHPR